MCEDRASDDYTRFCEELWAGGYGKHAYAAFCAQGADKRFDLVSEPVKLNVRIDP